MIFFFWSGSVNTNWGPIRIWPRDGKYKFGRQGPVNVNWGPGPGSGARIRDEGQAKSRGPENTNTL